MDNIFFILIFEWYLLKLMDDMFQLGEVRFFVLFLLIQLFARFAHFHYYFESGYHMS